MTDILYLAAIAQAAVAVAVAELDTPSGLLSVVYANKDGPSQEHKQQQQRQQQQQQQQGQWGASEVFAAAYHLLAAGAAGGGDPSDGMSTPLQRPSSPSAMETEGAYISCESRAGLAQRLWTVSKAVRSCPSDGNISPTEGTSSAASSTGVTASRVRLYDLVRWLCLPWLRQVALFRHGCLDEVFELEALRSGAGDTDAADGSTTAAATSGSGSTWWLREFHELRTTLDLPDVDRLHDFLDHETAAQTALGSGGGGGGGTSRFGGLSGQLVHLWLRQLAVWVVADPQSFVQEHVQQAGVVGTAPPSSLWADGPAADLRRERWRCSLPPARACLPLEIIELPKDYTPIFLEFLSAAARTDEAESETARCIYCDRKPQTPALCLACGALVCCNDRDCNRRRQGGCTRHASECGTGTAAFLLVRACTILLVMPHGRRCIWGSLYLDAHGEEDRDLRRGRQLSLDQGRLRTLEHLIATHGLHRDTRILANTGRHRGHYF